MNKVKQTHQKTIEQYRRDIFALKNKLKDEQLRLNELKQKYQDAEIFGDTSYSYAMKMKILEYNLNDIRATIKKFSAEEEFEYYKLNFATLALIKSCEVVGITRQMIFRGIDIDRNGQIGSFQFLNFLKEVLRTLNTIQDLDSQFTTPILSVLCPDESKPISQLRYHQFLASFMIESQQEQGNQKYLEESVMKVAKQLYKQSVNPQQIWKVREVNIAMVTFGLMKNVKFLDVLDCVACYCRCDPLRTGIISTSGLVNLLKQRINDCQSFQKGGVQFKLSKN